MKEKRNYNQVINILNSLYTDEKNLIANLSNTAAVIKQEFHFLWVGFYLFDEVDSNLVLGPFQGPLACTRIEIGKGVCGTSFKEAQSIVVPNVHEFVGHIACSSLSNSEIVIPILVKDKVVGVLDIDSELFDDFDEDDKYYLEEICNNLALNVF